MVERADEWPELDWPERSDAGRLVELLLPDESRLIGRLNAIDMLPGEDAETLRWIVQSDTGEAWPLGEAARWRWVGF